MDSCRDRGILGMPDIMCVFEDAPVLQIQTGLSHCCLCFQTPGILYLVTSFPLSPCHVLTITLSLTQRKLTPCLRLSLTWSATSDTMISAAVDKKDAVISTITGFTVQRQQMFIITQYCICMTTIPCVSSYSLESGERLFK